MLIVKDLKVVVEDKIILNGINLEVKLGEVYVIMGFNGLGKSMFVNVIVGCEDYEVESGSVLYKGEDFFEMEVDECVLVGIFMVFQYLVEILGVSIFNFFKSIVNVNCEVCGLEVMNVMQMLKYICEKIELVGMDEKFLCCFFNEGFFGGEKKCSEML